VSILQDKYKNLIKIASQWNKINPSDKQKLRSYYIKLRAALNDIARETIKQADPQGRYEKYYNTLVKKYKSKVPFDLKPYSGNSRDTDKLKKQIEKDLFSATKHGLNMTKLKVEFLEQAEKAYTQESLDAIKPRVTLLDIGSDRAKKVQRYIIKRVERGLNRQQSFDDVQKDVLKALESEYPNGYIEIPLDDKGKKSRKLSLIRYSEGWIQDMQSKVASQATISWMSAADVNIVEVAGGTTNNPICDPYSTPGSNVYWVDKPVPGLERLEAAPPYHPFCSKVLLPYFGDVPKQDYEDKPPETSFQKDTMDEIE
jgi:hypothetical protein